MPSSWSSRLLSNGSSSSNTPARGSSNTNKPLPRSPNEYLDQPTLHHDRNPASPSRSQPTSRKEHTRSSSNPLPKLFGRKKSSNHLRYNDTDLPPDDDLVPVADDRTDTQPARVLSGKKNKLDEDGTVNRSCMCCGGRVKIPRQIIRFRCTECLTLNDLKPVEEQNEGDKNFQPHMKRAETEPIAAQHGMHKRLCVEHTRTIINGCLIAYLEARTIHRDAPTADSKPSTAKEDVFGPERRSFSAPVRPREIREEIVAGRSLTDAPISSSPPDTPGETEEDQLPTATIRRFADFDQFAGTRIDTPPPDQKLSSQGPGPLASSIARKPLPAPPTRKPPPPPVNITNRAVSQRLAPAAGPFVPNVPTSPRPPPSPRLIVEDAEERRRYERIKSIFRPLEDYLLSSFGTFHSLNSSFSTIRPTMTGRTRSESNIPTPPPEPLAGSNMDAHDHLSELDAKVLLLGDIGENGSWWTGKFDRNRSGKAMKRKKVGEGSHKAVSSRSPNINWSELARWYNLIHNAGNDWRKLSESAAAEHSALSNLKLDKETEIQEIEADLTEARHHVVRCLLKITENFLKVPTRPIKEPEELRFLFIILSNPSLYPSTGHRPPPRDGMPPHRADSGRNPEVPPGTPSRSSPNKVSPGGGGGTKHTGLLKRIFGLLAQTPELCHRYMVGWLARLDESQFVRIVDLVASFVTYRIARRAPRPRSRSAFQDGGLIPDLSGSAMNTSAQLHSAMGLSGSMKSRVDKTDMQPDWADDWQIRQAAKFMSLLFAANNIWQGKPRELNASRDDSFLSTTNSSTEAKARRSGQLLHTSSFYNTLLDYQDLIADFKVWETKREKFAFCQYPLFISMGAKIKILEYDAHRQMGLKAREAYFDQVIERRAIETHFHLRVRRDCMVEDSFRQISEAVGAGQEELKKGLRVHFTGEEGVDAGGLRKEWFLLLVRDIFSPDHGMFVYDEDSNMCYFNPNSFETSDQYYLVGALLGLAIYNSTILDVALPPFAFRKLLAAAPPSVSNASNVSTLTGTKGQMTYTISDLAEFRPSLAAGLQQLLDYDGDVEATYCRDFVAPVEAYGVVKDVPLMPNGEKTPVTNANRHEFVDAYVRYLLDNAVARQFEPFKRGFFTVCAGNALSLFRAEEIELLIRGSDDALDVDSVRAVAVYENWRQSQPPHQTVPNPAEVIPVIAWFWELFAEATPLKQRKLLTFITGSDRIPAVGATSLVLRLVAGGDGWGGGGPEERQRFPVARTCFNMLILWRYDSREQLEGRLWRAVDESEGFGLK